MRIKSKKELESLIESYTRVISEIRSEADRVITLLTKQRNKMMRELSKKEK